MEGIVVLSGGVGAARFLSGLLSVTDPARVTAVVNVADDDRFYGLSVSPDIDTVLYTLAGLVHEEQGWGRREETFHLQEELARLGAETWFRLGDRDLATHVLRTEALAHGDTLTVITDRMRRSLGIGARILPATDAEQNTEVRTDVGWIAFQEYFVRRRGADTVHELRFVPEASPTPEVLRAVADATTIVIAPSNPFVSIGPILALRGLPQALHDTTATVVAVSPIVAGAAIKGPAAAMLASLGHDVSALGVARLYAGLADVFVLDESDAALLPAVQELGLRAVAVPTLMRDAGTRAALAAATLSAAAG
ncbi:MAG: 2-phospho-L-lactate transferase [Candidatus Limnocylindrales bacterium]